MFFFYFFELYLTYKYYQIMAVPIEQDGKTVVEIEAPEDSIAGNTRKGGKQIKEKRKNKVNSFSFSLFDPFR